MYDPRHRRRRRRRGPLSLSWTLALLAVAGVAATGYEYRSEVFRVAGLAPAAPSAVPTDGASHPSSDAREGEPRTAGRPRRPLVIHGTGDVNLDPSYIPALAANGYDYAWSGVRRLFREDDLTVINLECPVSDGGAIIPKEFNFRCDPDALPAARRAGVEVANLGNNHAYDYGPEALVDSLEHLRRSRIDPVGAGRDVRAALEPGRFRMNGWRVAVLGFGMVVDPFPESLATEDKPGIAGGPDTELMLRTVRRTARRADVVVVTIHWGVELNTAPHREQVELGQWFIDAGADAIFGHHAHRLQQMDVYRGKPIFWGLGNFVWPNFSYAGSVTGVGRVVVERDGDVRGRLLPAFIEAPGHPVLTER